MPLKIQIDSLNRDLIKAWLKHALVFLAPYLVALIPVFIQQVPKDWEYAVLVVWILNRIWDLLRRFISVTN